MVHPWRQTIDQGLLGGLNVTLWDGLSTGGLDLGFLVVLRGSKGLSLSDHTQERQIDAGT